MWSLISKCHTSPNNRQQSCFPSHPIFKPKHQDFLHINGWILKADIFNLVSVPSAAFEDDAIAVPVSDATAASCFGYVLISVTLPGDTHLIRVYAFLLRHVSSPTYVFELSAQINRCTLTFELYSQKRRCYSKLRFTHMRYKKKCIKKLKIELYNCSLQDSIK